MSVLPRLRRDQLVSTFAAEHAAALLVDDGARVLFETIDAYGGCYRPSRAASGAARAASTPAHNPATGPLFVCGTEPGDGLSVRIERIELGETGYVAVRNGIGVLHQTPVEPRVVRFAVRPDGLWLEERLCLPLRPMVGTIGVAPAAGEVPTLEQGYHGGNLDCREITAGTTVHLPVHVPGALLCLGDVHANMGSGEAFSGVNIDADVTVSVSRVPAAGWHHPWFETAGEIMTVGVEPTTDAAIRAAVADMAGLLRARLGVDPAEALALIGAACDVRLGQASVFGVRVSAYAAFPRSALPVPGAESA